MKILLRRVAAGMAVLGLVGWIGMFGYFAHLQSTSPSSPEPSLDRTVEVRNHGRRFYVTSVQDSVLQYGRIGSWIILATGIGVSICARPRP